MDIWIKWCLVNIRGVSRIWKHLGLRPKHQGLVDMGAHIKLTIVRQWSVVLFPSRGIRGHAPPGENVIHFKFKCINLVHFESSKIRAPTHFQCANWTNKKSQWQSKKGLEPLLVRVYSVLLWPTLHPSTEFSGSPLWAPFNVWALCSMSSFSKHKYQQI